MLSKSWFWLLFCILVGDYAYAGIPFPRCISADYFGPKPVTVKAGYSSNEKEAFTPSKKTVGDKPNGGFHTGQVVRWENTGLVTNGKDLVIRVRGAWTAWNKNNAKESKRDILTLEELEKIKYEGIKKDDHKKALPEWDHTCAIKETDDGCYTINEDGKIPCWFTNGQGAYLLFKEVGDPGDPNETLESMRASKYPTIHMGGKNMNDGIFRLSVSQTDEYNECPELNLSKKKMEIYVKIFDEYYFDNIGGYSLEVLSGASANTSHIFNDIYNFLKELFLINEKPDRKGVAHEMFDNIIHTGESFKNLTISLLCLFIVVSALLYIFGMVRDVYHDFIFRIVKVALVVTLLSPGSFKFFYDHFFGAFISGLELLINIVLSALGNSRSDTFDFMDDMFWTFTSYATMNKISALFLSQIPGSMLFVPLIFLAIIIYLVLCIYIFIIFLAGFVGIAFLIAIMPLFLLSILFSPLKSLFEGWLKFLISLCLKSLMMYTLLALFYSMIMGTFYKQLGFTTCYNQWLLACIPQAFPLIGGSCVSIPAWTVGQIFVPYMPISASDYQITDEEAKKLSREGGRFKFTGGKKKMNISPECRVPPKYREEEERYVDYPCYDLITENNRISEIQQGYVISLLDAFMLVLISFLMYSMRSIVQDLSANLAGGGFSMSNIASAVYDPSWLINKIKQPTSSLQKIMGSYIGAGIGVIKEFPDKFAGGTAKLVGRVPRIGGVLETSINTSRKIADAAALTTQIITTPQHDVKAFEKKLFKIFGIDEAYLSSNNKYDKYLNYYRLSVGAHLGYALGYTINEDSMTTHMGYAFQDAVKFGLQHDMHVLESGDTYRSKLTKDGPDDKHVKNVLYMAYLCREDFMKKLRDASIGVEAGAVRRRRGIEKNRLRREEEEDEE